MKKLLISTAIAALMSTTAMATNLSTDFFKSNGYTKPSISIVEIQAKVDSGKFYNFPAERIAGKTTKGLFKAMLKDGTVLPEIKNVTALLAALDKKQIVTVASANGSVIGALPIFEEIAKQNGISGTELMSFLVSNQAEGVDFFTNIEEAMADVDATIADMIDDSISEEIVAEVTAEIVEEVTVSLYEQLTSRQQGIFDRIQSAAEAGRSIIISEGAIANALEDAGVAIRDSVEPGKKLIN